MFGHRASLRATGLALSKGPNRRVAMTRALQFGLGLPVGAACSVGVARAQGGTSWPSKEVRLIVPMPRDSTSGLLGRILQDRMTPVWGQTVQIDEITGNSGLEALEAVAKSNDGHTLALGLNRSLAYAPFLHRHVPIDVSKDLAPVALLSQQVHLLAVHAQSIAATTLAEFVAWAKAKSPATVWFASLGDASQSRFIGELFFQEIGVKAENVSYADWPRAANAVATGHDTIGFMHLRALRRPADQGRVRLLGTSSTSKPESLKAVPAIAQAGFPQVESTEWHGLVMPAATPAAVIAKVNADVNAMMASQDIREGFGASGTFIPNASPAQFKLAIEADAKRMGPVIKRLGLPLV